MNVFEAIESRRSIRAFTDKPVSRETVEEIVRVSLRAPSGTNTQPWYVHVCAGDVRDAISRDVLDMAADGKAGKYEDYDYYPAKWQDVHRDRRREIGWALYGLLGIQKGDREASAKQGLRNFEIFDAPVGLFFTTDAYLGRGSWSDVGLLLQTVMLAARGLGLHTCPQAAWIQFQDPIFKHMQIPDTQTLVSGMSLGYANEDAIENTLVTVREDLANVTSFHGFG